MNLFFFYKEEEEEEEEEIQTMTIPPAFLGLFELPREIYLQVLFRIPFKYLIRLRCVSKLLLHLTNNPKFIATYYLQSKSNPNLLLNFNFIDTLPRRPSSLLLLPIDVTTNLWRFHIVIKDSNFINLGKLGLTPFRCPAHKYLVSSSSNGLICFAGLNSLEIYNIISGVNYLVESNMVDTEHKFLTYGAYVFGFDPASNDYKIVCFTTFPDWKMFSFRTNSWKPLVVKGAGCSTIWSNLERGLTVCINGVIYWPLHPEDIVDGNGFISFNLHKEELVRIKHPPLDGILPIDQCSDLQLLSFKGCPCFAYMKRSRKVGGGKSRKGAAEESSQSGGGGGCGFRVELFILKNNGGGGDDNGENNNEYWIRESIVTPFCFPKEVHIMSLYDQIFLTWFEAKHLKLYNLHTKCYVNLPRSPPGVYCPKVSRSKTKRNPTYVDNLRFDFTLI